MLELTVRFFAIPVFSILSVSQLFAQEVSTTDQSADKKSQIEEIVITGSRIARRDYDAESAIVTVDTESLRFGGQATLGEALNQLPQLSASSSSTTAGRDLQEGGQSKADLRGLGSRRTLVLLDGKRLQPSDIYNAIDLNGIPTALIESTEIITGGASAAYGSDALAGVINLKTRRDFSGFQLDVRGGITDESDGENVDASVTFGGNFADGRGNLVVSGSFFDREEIFPTSSRSFFDEDAPFPIYPIGLIAPSGTNLPSAGAIATVFQRYGITDPAQVPPFFSVFGMNTDGTLFARNGANFKPIPGARFVKDAAGSLGWNNDSDYTTLSLPLERYTAFTRGTYEITPNIEAFAQFNFATFETSNRTSGPALYNQPPMIPASNAFIPQDLRDILDSRSNPNADIFYVSYPLDYVFGRSGSRVDNDTWQLQYGLSGSIPSLDWTWDAHFSTGRTTIDQTQVNQLSRPVFLALINAPDGGVSMCEGGLNLFPLLSVSESCRQLLRRDPVSRQVLEQDAGEINIQGDLFELPAGDLRFAAGLAYRKNSFEYRPDAGLVKNPATGVQDILGLGIGSTAPSEGSTKAEEIYAELLIPLLSDMFLVERLDMNLGFRYSDYDSIGGAESYKIGFEWQPVKSLFIRAGQQRSIRAPSIGELFAPAASGSAGLGNINAGGGDPCSNNSVYRTGPDAQLVRQLCIAQGIQEALVDSYQTSGTGVPSLISGNTALDEEIGDSYNVGVVFRPEFASDLFSSMSFSVDYYDINIKDAMGIIPGGEAVRACFNADGGNPSYSNDNFFCQLITRETTTGNFFELRTPTVNLAEYHMSGTDFQVDWSFGLNNLGFSNDAGDLSLRLLLTHVNKYAIAQLEDSPLVDYKGTIGNNSAGGLSHPEWKGTAGISYFNGPLMVGMQARYIGSMDHYLNVGTSLNQPGVSSVTYFDFFSRYEFSDDLSLNLGVSNLSDKKPPEWTGFGATDRSTYDVIGRAYTLGVSLKF